MKFLDPKNDYAFKRIFGNENKKFVLISFLNSILDLSGDKTIIDVQLLNPNQIPHFPEAKDTILDIRCSDQSGAHYIVEIQVLKEPFFDKRVLYYVSKAYAGQLSIGEKYEDLSPIIFLGILDFPFTDTPDVISHHHILDIQTSKHTLRDFQFCFAELPKFNKTENELTTVVDKWLYFFKNAPSLKAIPEAIIEEAIKEAFHVLEFLNWNDYDIAVYEKRNMDLTAERTRLEYPEQQGIKKGIEQGRHIIISNLLHNGMPVSDVIALTQESEDTILEIAANVKKKRNIGKDQ